jgi:hypothetical protein
MTDAEPERGRYNWEDEDSITFLDMVAPPPIPDATNSEQIKTLETRARQPREQTEIEIWPEEDESRDDFMDRCIDELTPCIGDRADEVCVEKWDASGKLGKKGFVARDLLTGDLAIAPCGKTCLACDGAPAPFEKDWDEDKHPRVPAGSPDGGQFGAGGGGSDDELGSLALGGEDRFKTESTRKVDKLRDEMGVIEDDIPFKQRQALDMYSANSTAFNQHVRDGKPGAVAESSHLDTLVSSHKLPRDITVYRTVGWQRTKSLLDHVDSAFSDPGFMSTTLDKSKIDKPGSYIEIQIPKGSTAFPVGSLSNYPEEAEILFPRGSRLQIISHEPRGPNTERFVARLVS